MHIIFLLISPIPNTKVIPLSTTLKTVSIWFVPHNQSTRLSDELYHTTNKLAHICIHRRA